MNLRRTMYKLQRALVQKGMYVKIDQYQSYSTKLDAMVTKYVLKEKREIENNRGELVRKDVVLFESYQIAEVVLKLAEMYGGG